MDRIGKKHKRPQQNILLYLYNKFSNIIFTKIFNIDHLTEVRGLIYGKCTPPLQKGYNKKLQSWLCFSLVLKSRTLDFYCDEDRKKY